MSQELGTTSTSLNLENQLADAMTVIQTLMMNIGNLTQQVVHLTQNVALMQANQNLPPPTPIPQSSPCNFSLPPSPQYQPLPPPSRQYSRHVLWPQNTRWPKWPVVTGQLRPVNNRWANRHKYIYCTALIDWFAIVLVSTIMDFYWVLIALGSWPTMKDLFRLHCLSPQSILQGGFPCKLHVGHLPDPRTPWLSVPFSASLPWSHVNGNRA